MHAESPVTGDSACIEVPKISDPQNSVEKLSFAYTDFQSMVSGKILSPLTLLITQIKNWLNYVVLRIKMEGKMREYSLLQL